MIPDCLLDRCQSPKAAIAKTLADFQATDLHCSVETLIIQLSLAALFIIISIQVLLFIVCTHRHRMFCYRFANGRGHYIPVFTKNRRSFVEFGSDNGENKVACAGNDPEINNNNNNGYFKCYFSGELIALS